MMKRFPVILAVAVALAGLSSPAPAREPVNLSVSKAAVQAYVDTGHYDQDLAAVAQSAADYLTQRIPRGAQGKKMALILDIDETALSNAPHIIAQDYGYVSEVWDRWVLSAQARAILPVQAVYALAVRNQVAVFFITGREETQRAATEKNLRDVGYATWTKAYFRSPAADGKTESTADYKTRLRREVESAGYVIIANIGDQESDLAGGHAEKPFKLPNPFYRVD